MFTFNKSFFDNIVEICLKAGNAILEEYEKPLPKIFLKEDSSPVTEADLRADDIIVTNLFKLDKSIPCISEESSGANNFFDEKLFWAVDPLDGTKEFIKNWRFYSQYRFDKQQKTYLRDCLRACFG